MKTHSDLIQRSATYSTARINAYARIQHCIAKTQELERKQIQLTAKKYELLQRIDALEAQVQALKNSQNSRAKNIIGPIDH